MASLQTLRNKGGVIVAVVIGLALLSFVLGDMLTSGSTLFGSERTAGEIEGDDVSIQQYSERVNYLQQINAFVTGSESSSPEQTEQVQAQAWESFIREIAFLPQLEKMGVKTTSEELKDLFYGANPSPLIAQLFADQQTGLYDPQSLKAFVSNIDKDQTGKMSIFWQYLQSEVADQATVNKLRVLVDKAAYTTALQAKMAAQLAGSNYNVKFVSKLYTSIADTTIAVTDAELKACYDARKAMFRTNESRTINYVLFETMPSNDDFIEAEKYITSLTADFAAAENPMMFAKANTQSQLNERYFSQDELSGPMAIFAFGASRDSVYGPTLIGEQYTLARVADVKNVPDTLDLSHIVLAPSQEKTADSLFNAIKTGANFETEAPKFSLDQQTAQLGGKIGAIDPQTLPNEFTKELLSANNGDVKLVKTPQSIHIFKVNKVINVKPRVQLAVVNYTVEPSDITRNAMYARAKTFSTNATGNITTFQKILKDSTIIPRTAVVAPNQKSVQGLNDSHELVSWAYNLGDKEKVSNVMSFGDNFVVAALIDAAEKGYQPFEKVKTQLTQLVRRDKKGEIISKEFASASSIEALATQMGDSVKMQNDVNFNTYLINDVGQEPAFAGAVCAMQPNKLSKPVVGSLGVYLIQIDSQTPNPTSPEVEKQRITAENMQTAFMRTYQAFLDMSDIRDLRYKFY